MAIPGLPQEIGVVIVARPTWKGQIAFGLVNVPVQLYTAEQHNDISFHLIDTRNWARRTI